MPQVEARYDYHDAEGSLVFQVERLVPKGFRQRRPDGEGGWIYSTTDVQRVLYRLPVVLAAIEAQQWIFLPEGEKDVRSIEERGKVATTSPGGAGKWQPQYTETLQGAKVAIVADNDDSGRKHALRIACELDGVAAKLLVYTPPAGCKDITEMFEAGLGFKDLVPFDWVAARASVQVVSNGHAPLKILTVKELMATPDAQEHDYLCGPLVLKGSRVVIGAHTGDGKTTFGLQCLSAILMARSFLSWKGSGNGTRALVLDAEQGLRTVKRRFIEAGLDQIPEKVHLVHVPDGLALDVNQREIEEMESILKAGKYDLVFADPLYKLHRGDANDERKAVDLMRRFDYWRERFGFALILPMHCRKPQPGQKGALTIHDILGSSGYTRGAEVVLGLQRKSSGYSHLHWFKDREGDLECLGEKWGLKFNREAGFFRDPKDLEERPVFERVRAVVAEYPGLKQDQLVEATGEKWSTIRNQLDKMGAVHDGERLVADRHWRLPPTLFDTQQEDEVGSAVAIA